MFFCTVQRAREYVSQLIISLAVRYGPDNSKGNPVWVNPFVTHPLWFLVTPRIFKVRFRRLQTIYTTRWPSAELASAASQSEPSFRLAIDFYVTHFQIIFYKFFQRHAQSERSIRGDGDLPSWAEAVCRVPSPNYPESIDRTLKKKQLPMCWICCLFIFLSSFLKINRICKY